MKNRIQVSTFGAHTTTNNITATNTEKTKKKEPHIVLEILNDYCSSSSLHGISYIGAKDKSLAEKIWWAIMFILSMATCAFLINKTWIKWKENPVIISFEKEQIPIWQIPFPAVTICAINKIAQTKFNYTEMFRNRDNLNEKNYKLFSDLSLVCNLKQYGDVFNSTIQFTDESAIDSIRKMAQDSIVQSILWKNSYINASYFANQLTEEGLCFSFNSFSQEDMFTNQINGNTKLIGHDVHKNGWNIEDGYLPELNMPAYPLRTAKDGQISGLSILLGFKSLDIDFVCGLPISGYKVILHNPAETPKVAEQYFLIPLNTKVSVMVSPELTKTEQNLRSLPTHTRKCYFSNEKSLRFFNVYTENNCRVECDANVTQHYCDCVPFHMPRDNNSRICGYGKVDCIREVQRTILDIEVQEKLTEIYGDNKEKLEYTRELFSQCDCLPSCTSLHYTAETSHTEFHVVKSLLAAGVGITPEEKIYADLLLFSQVDIFFKKSQFLALHRSELYGQIDFLANCGGLLGLFLGFSLLSLLEIFYFLTIRLWFKYRNRRQHSL